MTEASVRASRDWLQVLYQRAGVVDASRGAYLSRLFIANPFSRGHLDHSAALDGHGMHS